MLNFEDVNGGVKQTRAGQEGFTHTESGFYLVTMFLGASITEDRISSNFFF